MLLSIIRFLKQLLERGEAMLAPAEPPEEASSETSTVAEAVELTLSSEISRAAGDGEIPDLPMEPEPLLSLMSVPASMYEGRLYQWGKTPKEPHNLEDQPFGHPADGDHLDYELDRLYSNDGDLEERKFDKAGGTVTGDLTVEGILTVQNTVSLETTEVKTADNTIRLNDGETGPGVAAGTSGLEVDRGASEPAATLHWLESAGRWVAGLAGSESPLIRLMDAVTSPVADKVAKYDEGGRLKSAVPVDADDVARKQEIDDLSNTVASQNYGNHSYSGDCSPDYTLQKMAKVSTPGTMTLTATNVPNGGPYFLKVESDGEYTIATNGLTLRWPSDITPVASASGKTDLYSFYRIDDTLYGTFALNYS